MSGAQRVNDMATAQELLNHNNAPALAPTAGTVCDGGLVAPQHSPGVASLPKLRAESPHP